MVTIYVLLEDKQIRYIGKTTMVNLSDKLEQHIEEARLNPGKFEWISKLDQKGHKPDIKAIFTYDEEEAEYYEDLFINDYRFLLGLKLSESDYSRTQSMFQTKRGVKSPLSMDSWISPN